MLISRCVLIAAACARADAIVSRIRAKRSRKRENAVRPISSRGCSWETLLNCDNLAVTASPQEGVKKHQGRRCPKRPCVPRLRRRAPCVREPGCGDYHVATAERAPGQLQKIATKGSPCVRWLTAPGERVRAGTHFFSRSVEESVRAPLFPPGR